MATINFDVKKGFTFKRHVLLRNKKTQEVLDLSDDQISGEIVKGTLVVPYLVTMTADGGFDFELSDGVTAGLAATDYKHILRRRSADGSVRPLFEGNFKVTP